MSCREEEKNRTRAKRVHAEHAAVRRASGRRRARWLVALLGEHATALSHRRRNRGAAEHARALARGIHVPGPAPRRPRAARPERFRLPHPCVPLDLHQRPTDHGPDGPRHRSAAALHLTHPHPRQRGDRPHRGLPALPVHPRAALHDLGCQVQRLPDRRLSRRRWATSGRLRQRPARARSNALRDATPRQHHRRLRNALVVPAPDRRHVPTGVVRPCDGRRQPPGGRPATFARAPLIQAAVSRSHRPLQGPGRIGSAGRRCGVRRVRPRLEARVIPPRIIAFTGKTSAQASRSAGQRRSSARGMKHGS